MAMLQFPQPKLVEKTGEGTWRLTGRVILPEDGSLDRAAALLGEDYPALAAAEKVRGGAVRPGDLVVRLGQPEVLAGKTTFDEGFTVEVGASAELTAQSRRAAVYGLRTVFEAGELAFGRLADWPCTNERGLHLDAGRKYYTKDWIMERVKDLSRNRMNVLWLHFSENEGFRIDSERHPEVPSRFHLTKDEVREIIALCGELFVDINPALDCPGHLGAALLEHPRWRLNREMAEPLYSALDITNPDARAFLLELVDEYAELFAGSKVFHIGGDEFIDFNHFERFPEMDACARERLGPDCGGVDLYVDFLNQVIAHVRAKGFQVRVWNDGLFRPDQAEHVELDRNVQIAFWSNWDKGMAPLKAFLDRGYQVVNYHSEYLYFILLIRKDYSDPDPDKILTQWHPGMFPTHPVSGPQTLDPKSEQMLGCCYSIWSDWPDLEDEEEVDRRSRDSIRAFGIRCWQ
ncbi:MAG: family 20 glycosylhydrolase [Oscillospiraceae bacterium]|nr:family 20 glycosylhydrolase [Oscillospiraceae bacterium]